MALTLSSIRLLARSHARRPFSGPVLTLGRQGVYATLDQVKQALESQGARPHPLPQGTQTETNVPAFRADPTTSDFTNDTCLFGMLCGEPAETLDVSDYEDAEHIQDLNQPIPDALRGRFGVVIDGGTLEHIFDVPQALRNMKAMLRPGGRIIHLNPMNSWAEHGFYQLSPTLYHDFYTTNGFRMDECLIVGTTLANTESLYAQKSPLWRWSPDRPSAAMTSGDMLSIYFEAEKLADVPDHVPQQGEAARGASSSQLGGVTGEATLFSRLRTTALRVSPRAGRYVLLGKQLLKRDLSTKPWGLDYIGRI